MLQIAIIGENVRVKISLENVLNIPGEAYSNGIHTLRIVLEDY